MLFLEVIILKAVLISMLKQITVSVLPSLYIMSILMCSEEARARDVLYEDQVKSLRKAAEVHKEARSYIQGKIKPGVKLWDICCDVEDRIRHIIKEKGPEAGMGFPTGCSLNNVAAHYTPNPGDETVLKYGDVMKFDFGTQVNGKSDE